MMLSIGMQTPEARYRYASDLGPAYVMPIYFDTLASARRWDRQTQAAIGCLPGMTTMHIERLGSDGEWRALDREAGK